MQYKYSKILKIIFIIIAILFILPSAIYLAKNKTVLEFNTNFNFFIQNNSYKVISTLLYLVIFTIMTIIYILFIKKNVFKNIKQLLIYTGILGSIFLIMLPWTSSDIFYYMGVGELNSAYGQNPYYVAMKEYYEENEENIDDEILEKGVENNWSDKTVVYGPIAQIIFTVLTKLSFKNIDLCVFLFKLLNLIVHIINCYLIYKLTKKMKFTVLYALNPFILLEAIANVHNDIIIVTLILIAIYYLIKKRQLLPCIIFLALATGIKYFTILLMPIVILYYFQDEKSIYQKLIKCIKYGAIFLGIVIMEYVIFYEDINIFFAVCIQNMDNAKSVYSVTCNILNKFNVEYRTQILNGIKYIVVIASVIIYIKILLDLLISKNIKFSEAMRKYNLGLVMLLLCITSFQQWYIIWIFATLFWQKSKNIKRVINLCFVLEVANSVYMFITESVSFDGIFVRYSYCRSLNI